MATITLTDAAGANTVVNSPVALQVDDAGQNAFSPAGTKIVLIHAVLAPGEKLIVNFSKQANVVPVIDHVEGLGVAIGGVSGVGADGGVSWTKVATGCAVTFTPGTVGGANAPTLEWAFPSGFPPLDLKVRIKRP